MRLPRQSANDRPRLRISLGLNIVILLAVTVAAAVCFGSMLWWLLGRPPIGQVSGWTTANSFDFAKIVLALIGGVGAVVALVVAYRKQQLGESAEQREEIKLFAERFTKAADQLGSEKAAVRLAGMYALEDLAQGSPPQRQTIVNVLCAYLRMPYAPPTLGHSPSPGHPASPDGTEVDVVTEPTQHVDQNANERRHQELQVRLTAQRILSAHLRLSDRTGKFWSGIDLDLTGATLTDLDFSRCGIRTAQFDQARFVGRANFSETRFSGDAAFGQAEFYGDAEFGEVEFTDFAGFGGVKFRGLTRFSEVKFHGEARFDEAEFGWLAGFDGADFARSARFDDARFAEAWFSLATFGGLIRFSGVTFGGDFKFDGVRVRLDSPGERSSILLGGLEIEKDARLPEQDQILPDGVTVVHPPTEKDAHLPNRAGRWGYLKPIVSADQEQAEPRQ